MITRMKFLTITALTAGLFMGSAALAQGVSQSDKVSYALTLIDAGDGSANSATGGPVTETTEKVRVKVTVSVPRTEGAANYGGIINSANPVRLMYRKHNGTSTAFNGSISLVRDAPYTVSGSTYGGSLKSAYYPMPQVNADGLSKRDPQSLNYFAVENGETENVAGVAYETYIANGQAHDPARWEATYLSPAYEVASLGEAQDQNPMIYSLLNGLGTYEWYAASRYGMSSFTRISPIQDIARAMSFTDIRLWQPLEIDASSQLDAASMDATSKITLGEHFELTTRAMPDYSGDSGWHIYRGAIGVNDMGSVGVQLLNVLGNEPDYSNYARIESPDYPDGVGSIIFEAMVSAQDLQTDQTLMVQGYIDNKWEEIKTVVLTKDIVTYTVDFEENDRGKCTRFRLIRTSQLETGGAANALTMIVRNLFVRSAKPEADFGKPLFSPVNPAYNTYDTTGALIQNGSFQVKFRAKGGETAPRGYSAILNLRRRAEGDSARDWKVAPVTVAMDSTNPEGNNGNATLSSTFTRNTLLTNPDGSVNADEGAFFLDTNGKVSGLLPGVYDLALKYSIFGSFKAGRNIIDEYETVEGNANTYEVEFEDSNGQPQVQHRPNVLDVREHETSHKDVFLRVMYRSGTTDSTTPYTLQTLDVPLLPSSREPNLWRVDLSRTLRLEDESAVYGWGYDPVDEAEPLVFVEDKIAFTVYAVSENEAGEQLLAVYGQDVANPGSSMPPTAEVVPAFTETLCKTKLEDVVPMVLDVEKLTSSHVMIELELPEDPLSAADAFVRVAASYWQDFNTWYATSDSFTETEFRENLRSRVADFDCTVEEDDGDYYVTSGWIPDEGPLADTTSFVETFEVGRDGIDNYAFFMPNQMLQAGNGFVSWGASPDRALAKYLRVDNDPLNYKARYVKFNSNAEIVLNRTYHRQSTDFLPDAQIRLRGTGAFVSPLSNGAGGIELSGVGEVSFTLGLSLPYDLSHRAQLLSTSSDSILGLTGYGLASAVQIPSTTACAASGYSVSYYLEDLPKPLGTGDIFELRVTQMIDFGTSNVTNPEQMVVAELYKWSSGIATRLPLAETSGTTITSGYYRLGNSLNGNTYGLWVRSDGKLAIGYTPGSTPTEVSMQCTSKNAVVNTSSSTGYILSIGSAECRPVFRQFMRSTGRTNAFGGSSNLVTAITPSEVMLLEPSTPSWGDSWRASDDPNSTRVQITRRTPVAEKAGAVKIRAEHQDGSSSDAIIRSTDKTGEKVTVVLGEANSTLIIEPEGEESNIFLDNISVTSWCGNDENRNGSTHVPAYTDVGFYDVNGFAGVGLWIRADTSDQLTAAPAEYLGNQCLLMQRSRQNPKFAKEVTTNGVVNTGASLALYSPFSNTGFGPVSFRYCIPQSDEFGGGGELPPVYVMLQYLKSSTYYNNYLEDVALREWENVSDPIELRNTQGEWRTASIIPKLNDQELIGENSSGTLRLVMVIKSSDEDYDPYVYIDDFTVTDNNDGAMASWTARNVKLTDNPIDQLFWKDRVPTSNADPEEESFAEKSSLTRALQFNDVTSGYDTDNIYDSSIMDSPLLETGVGRISFAARLTEKNEKPVRLYILATESEADAELATYKPVTYVEVTNTVYNVYDVDLSKYTHYYTKPDPETLLPESTNSSDTFTASAIRRIRLRAYLKDDGVTSDEFGDVSENRKPNPGRVLVDTLAISAPVLPTLRVESVAFSNVAGSDTPSEFDRQSPLSQPISNAPLLRVMVELGHMQLLRDDTIRVFMTVNPHNIESTPNVKRYTSNYNYEDVFGNLNVASDDQPIYAWNNETKGSWEKWTVSNWFGSAEAKLPLLQPETGIGQGPLTIEQLTGRAIPNTIELTRSQTDRNCFFGNLTELGINGLPVNSLVQYTAWAVYKSEETDQWFATQITPSTHTDFPWYFPRNLNLENRMKYAEVLHKEDMANNPDDDNLPNLSADQILAKYDPGANFFSPYYWVYSCTPGEVFVNEFNLRDQVNVEHNLKSFVEVCAPVGLDLVGWKIDFTSYGTEVNFGMRWPIKPLTDANDDLCLQKPARGAVPTKRDNVDVPANRSFYTVFTSESDIFHMKDGEKQTTLAGVEDTVNAGVAVRGWQTETLSSNAASTVQLLRPTGGAEHIVVFSTSRQSALEAANEDALKAAMEEVDDLYDVYQAAYVSMGFGSEWYQTFQEDSWENDDGFGEIKRLEDISQAKAHGRRLTKANFFPSAGITTNNRFDQKASTCLAVQDVATLDYPNSIATIDMGGMWVTRLNTNNTDAVGGPLDLTELYAETWPDGHNPVYTSRINEPEPGYFPDGVTPALAKPYTQVTPRQINLDQYLFAYSGIAQSFVVSEIEGNHLGMHELGIYGTTGAENTIVETHRGGRVTPSTWPLSAEETRVQLTYTALPFQQIASVKLRLINAKSGEPEMDLSVIEGMIPDLEIEGAVEAGGWVTLKIDAHTETHAIVAVLKKDGTSDEGRYNLEAKAAFELNPDSNAKDIITKVSPYCGGSATSGSTLYQPWWGSSFGFEVLYDTAAVEAKNLVFSGVVVTYPSHEGLGQGFGIQNSPWSGYALTYVPDPGKPDETETVSLVGKEYAEALTLLNTAFRTNGYTRYVEIKGAEAGRVADTSLVGILSDTYAAAMGYKEDDPLTYAKKEPAIPFCVWGVYTYTIQTASGPERVSFLMPQAAPGEMPSIFEYPSWYKPLTDLNTGKVAADTAPYFYLYSTPPQSAWVNEVNVQKGPDAGSDPYAEVVMPNLRNGILQATPAVPQTTNDGWFLKRYAMDGSLAEEVSLKTAMPPVASYSSSYTYNIVDIASLANQEQSAYVLMRPCGAAEGGVWLGVDETGNTAVPASAALTENTWLVDPDCYVVPGKTDAVDAAGSVQLVGKLNSDACLSSAVADRTEWAFAAESKALPNDGDISPDRAPEWNSVRITSSIRNTVYGGVLCGYQLVPGFFDVLDGGVASTEGAVSEVLGGSDWVYDASLGRTNVLSYRPRTNYRFESITLPAELIGHVMLIGSDGSLPEAAVSAQVEALRKLAETNPDARTTDWIRMGRSDGTSYRAEVEYHEQTGEPTGVIRFNPDYVVSEDVTFGDQSDFIITLVFADEPVSAQNRIEVAMGQGDVQFGAWLITQTFWAQDENGDPDETKGGNTVEMPIWSDEDGNKDGEYTNLHGWLYQPIVGDKVGMSAVINPELGLTGGRLGRTVEEVRNRLEMANAPLRPFLVWTLIPKEKVPVEVFSGSGTADADVVTFFDNWALHNWIGGTPAVSDQTTIGLSELRHALQTTVTLEKGFYRAAGIIPMTWRGYCTTDRDLQTDPSVAARAEETLLAFTTMSATELETALTLNSGDTGLTNDGAGLMPYTSTIDMTDEELWQDGAVLRFAIILANPKENLVYDCQSLANFSSEGLSAYCPWYVPDPVVNINRTTSAQNAGISPFAWVYSIARGGVWLNEIRPFAAYTGATAETASMPSVVELAMRASPLETRDDGNYVAKHSLDGWKLVMKTAPMPLPGTAVETPLEWEVRNTIDLVGWIPYRRIDPDYNFDEGDNAHYYDLDFYCVTTDVKAGFATDTSGSLLNYGYPSANSDVTLDNFKWLKLDSELFTRNLDADLRKTEKYASGVVYAIALVRNNGVVADEVLFYNSEDGLDASVIPERMQIAIDSEKANNCVAGEVRGITLVPMPIPTALASSAQFAKYPVDTNGNYECGWIVELTNASLNTFPGANIWSSYLQPQLDYAPQIATYSSVTARILGGDAILSLAKQNGNLTNSGKTVSATYLTGSSYALTISDWNRDWYILESVRKNGQSINPTLATGTTYALNSTGTLSASPNILVDEDTLQKNTDYALTFVYTPNAAKLIEAGALESDDDGFMDWLLQTDPEAVLSQMEADGVTAAEKYWLGLDSAKIDASDVNLAITEVGTHVEPDETLPTVSVSLKKGETEISNLSGDGVLILLGKESMDDEWQYVRRLHPDDINGDTVLILRTPCKFFKALLLSEAQAEDYK